MSVNKSLFVWTGFGLVLGLCLSLFVYHGNDKMIKPRPIDKFLSESIDMGRPGPLLEEILTMRRKFTLRKVQDLVNRNATARDPELISVVRELIEPPSQHDKVKVVRQIVDTPQSEEVRKILNGKRKGFFLEVGALDGERSSNTLKLETSFGWTGLLIEMDPYYYTQLRAKCRKSWSINACLSPSQRPMLRTFREASGGTGTLTDGKGRGNAMMIPCFPLESMLLALNISHVDYWSLDVEGFELEILKTVPFERVDISVLSVEYEHGRSGKGEYKKFMESNGYRTHKDIRVIKPEIALYVFDYIFVKNN